MGPAGGVVGIVGAQALFAQAHVGEEVHQAPQARAHRHPQEHAHDAEEAAAHQNGDDDPETAQPRGVAQDLRPDDVAVQLLEGQDEDDEVQRLDGGDQQDQEGAGDV